MPDMSNARRTFNAASLYSRDLYVLANPDSDIGDPNVADRLGYSLVCYRGDGLMIYRRKAWARFCDQFRRTKR